MEKPFRVFSNPYLIFKFLAGKGLLNWLSDEPYLRLMYRAATGRKLDLRTPRLFNEKLQWLKLYDRNPMYTVMADKVKAKDYVAERIGRDYIIPTLGVWDAADDVDFGSLPERFVIKCNHNSGKGMYICRDRNMMDERKVRDGLRKGLAEDYYKHGREWPYRDIPRRILAEQYMEDESGCELKDYKFFCFNGEPKFMYLSNDLSKNARTDFFDMDYTHLNMRMKDSNSQIPPALPEEFDEMKDLSIRLSKGIPFLRVDFYIINHKVYFGELTFYHNAGFFQIFPLEWNSIIGDWIQL